MVAPVMISFSAVIFRDTFFAPYLSQLAKITLFVSALHQLSMTLFSTLPFAVGQVQDAGLIFLSAMASSVVSICTAKGADNEATMATTVITLAAGTALLGLCLIITGKLRLASFVQFLPMPVVGGYLAYIGLFCLQGGCAFMGSAKVATFRDWGAFLDPHTALLILPGLATGIFMLIMAQTFRHFATLPLCMVAILAGFYATLFFSGASMEDARAFGWVSPDEPSQNAFQAWDFFKFDRVIWSAVPHQLLSWFAMLVVVGFSSSLDVAAIEMELGRPLNINHELKTIGLANLISGLAGGYTGSYIFSQTIFCMRSGITSRLCGLTVVIVELCVFALPFSITAWMPKLFFGGLLCMIGIDLMTEWLWQARNKMMTTEYLVNLSSFVLCIVLGVEFGLACGVLLAMLSFTVTYAGKTDVTATSLRSSDVLRTFEERSLLAKYNRRVLSVCLHGYIFFGSAVSILEDVKAHVTNLSVHNLSSAAKRTKLSTPPAIELLQFLYRSILGGYDDIDDDGDDVGGMAGNRQDQGRRGAQKAIKGSGNGDRGRPGHRGGGDGGGGGDNTGASGTGRGPSRRRRTRSRDAWLVSPSTNHNGGQNDDDNDDEVEYIFPTATPVHHRGGNTGVFNTPRAPRGAAARRAWQRRNSAVASGRSRQQTHDDLSGTFQSTNRSSRSASFSRHGLMRANTMQTSRTAVSRLTAFGAMSTARASTVSETEEEKQSLISSDSAAASSSRAGGYGAASPTIPQPSDTGVPQLQGDAPIFVRRVFVMVENSTQNTPAVAAWAPDGQSFCVRDTERFRTEHLSATFYHRNFRSFVRQLNMYGFADQVDSARSSYEFRHPLFRRSEPGLLKQIRRTTARGAVSIALSSRDAREEEEVTSGESSSDTASAPKQHRPQESPSSSSFKEGFSVLRSIWKYQGRASAPTFVTQKDGQPSEHAPVAAERGEDDDLDEQRTDWVILDFTEVAGVDATAARSCFLMLKQLLGSVGISLVYSALSKEMEDLLRSHRVIDEDDEVFPSLMNALEYCEEELLSELEEEGNAPNRGSHRGLARNPSYYRRAALNRQYSFLVQQAKMYGQIPGHPQAVDSATAAGGHTIQHHQLPAASQFFAAGTSAQPSPAVQQHHSHHPHPLGAAPALEEQKQRRPQEHQSIAFVPSALQAPLGSPGGGSTVLSINAGPPTLQQQQRQGGGPDGRPIPETSPPRVLLPDGSSLRHGSASSLPVILSPASSKRRKTFGTATRTAAYPAHTGAVRSGDKPSDVAEKSNESETTRAAAWSADGTTPTAAISLSSSGEGRIVHARGTTQAQLLRGLRSMLEDYLEVGHDAASPINDLLSAEALGQFFEARLYQSGSHIFKAGMRSDAIYFVLEGSVELLRPPTNEELVTEIAHADEGGAATPGSAASVRPSASNRLRLGTSGSAGLGSPGVSVPAPQRQRTASSEHTVSELESAPSLAKVQSWRDKDGTGSDDEIALGIDSSSEGEAGGDTTEDEETGSQRQADRLGTLTNLASASSAASAVSSSASSSAWTPQARSRDLPSDQTPVAQDLEAGWTRLCKIAVGGTFGERGFVLNRRRLMMAVARHHCVLWVLTRKQFARMEAQNPHLCILVQHAMLKGLSLDSQYGSELALRDSAIKL